MENQKEIQTETVEYKDVIRGIVYEGVNKRVVLNDSHPDCIEFLGVNGIIGNSLFIPRKNMKIIARYKTNEFNKR